MLEENEMNSNLTSIGEVIWEFVWKKRSDLIEKKAKILLCGYALLGTEGIRNSISYADIEREHR